MFTSTITKQSNAKPATDHFAILINPTGNTKIAKLVFFSIEYTYKKNSIWEFYLNPVITTNGTLATITTIHPSYDTTNTISLYSAPVISSTDSIKMLRRFTIPSYKKEFSTSSPFIQLEPGDSLLISKLTSSSGEVTNTWRWAEINI